MKAIIAGGGTGGHIFPAVAIANALQRLDAASEILFVGALGKMEMEKVPQAGYKIIGLDIVGFNRSNLLKNIWLPFKLWKSRRKAKEIIDEFKPDIVIGVGGFASFPMLHAAQALGIPTMIQEQNSFAGKSNKILGKKAKAICVAYENMAQFFPQDKLIKTGNPVRAAIAQSLISQDEGRQAFDLGADKKTVLIVGGSLGAKAINEAIGAGLEHMMQAGIQLIWQTGKPFYEQARHLAKPYGTDIKVHEFIKNMEDAYAAADVVVSRAGALAIAELSIVAKPVIFVPYPFAAEDHQASNAQSLVAKQAALMIKNEDADQHLVTSLLELISNKEKQQMLHTNLQKEGIRNADERIAKIAIELAK